MRKFVRDWHQCYAEPRAETAGNRRQAASPGPALSGARGRDSGVGKNKLALIGAKEYYCKDILPGLCLQGRLAGFKPGDINKPA
jgi:hypothetical protein